MGFDKIVMRGTWVPYDKDHGEQEIDMVTWLTIPYKFTGVVAFAGQMSYMIKDETISKSKYEGRRSKLGKILYGVDND